MKIFFLTTLLLLCFSNYGQIKSGIVTYGVTVIEDKDSQIDKLMLSMNANYYSIIKEFDFALKFNSEKALFIKVEKMYSDDAAADMGNVKIRFNGNSMIRNDSVFSEFSSRKIGDFIVKNELNKNWTLKNESKLIGAYKCFKAITEEVVITKETTFRHPITAWYCPEIPFLYGPLGYGGLPGLILELQTKNGVYGVKKIQLSQTVIEIENLKKYKIIQREELNKLIEEIHSN
jgi:GLPGLI family protein